MNAINRFKGSCCLLVISFAASIPATVYADDQISFSFAPPPITKQAEDGKQVSKLNIGVTNMEFESEVNTQEFSIYSVNYLSKQKGDFASLSLSLGEDDAGTTSLAMLGTQLGIERFATDTTAFSMALNLNLMSMSMDAEIDIPGSYYSQTISTDTAMLTYGVNAALQQEIRLGNNISMTPYIMGNYVAGGFGSSESNGTSTDIEIDPYFGLQLGLDISIGGISLASFYQETDTSNITSLSFGFEF